MHVVLLDNTCIMSGVVVLRKNLSSSIATCLQSVGHSMPRDSDFVPSLNVAAIWHRTGFA